MEDFSNWEYEDLCYKLAEEEEYLSILALCPAGVTGEAFKIQQEIVDAIYDELERRADLYR